MPVHGILFDLRIVVEGVFWCRYFLEEAYCDAGFILLVDRGELWFWPIVIVALVVLLCLSYCGVSDTGFWLNLNPRDVGFVLLDSSGGCGISSDVDFRSFFLSLCGVSEVGL